MKYLLGHPVPERRAVVDLCEELLQLLFPLTDEPSRDFDPKHPDNAALEPHLIEQLEAVLSYGDFDPAAVARALLKQLNDIHSMLFRDAQLTEQGDPAATNLVEVFLSYPGLRAIAVYRLAHVLYRQRVPILPRMMSEWVHASTGVDIHPGAQIDCPFHIDHGTGVVIGETAVVGKNVHIYQGVTLGALAVSKIEAGVKRHPTVGDNVIIYANSTILGGKTEIGHDSVIGGNSWLTKSILPWSVVHTRHETIVRDRSDYEQPIDFSI